MAFKLSLRRASSDRNQSYAEDRSWIWTGPAIVTLGAGECARTSDAKDQGSLISHIGIGSQSDEYVKPAHCTLIYTGSGFRLDFEDDSLVFLDRSNEAAMSLCDPFLGRGSKVVLRLGRPVFPRESASREILLERLDANAARSTKRRPSGQDSIERIRRTRRTMRWLIPAVLSTVVLLIALGVGVLNLRTQVARLDQYQGRDFQTVSDQVAPSVGLIGVIGNDAGGFRSAGTGWLCCDGMGGAGFVVSNIHVLDYALAQQRHAGEGAQVVVLFPAVEDAESQASRSVVLFGAAPVAGAARRHPLHGGFNAFLNENGISSTEAISVYDAVAIPLSEPDTLRLIGEGRRPLSLLQPGERAARTGAGRPVAAIGYPFENLPLAYNADSVSPRIYGANIVRRTNAFVAAYDPGQDMPALLALPAESAGGISGSPVLVRLGDQWRVAGLIMAGSFAEHLSASGATERRPTSNTVFAADVRAVEDAIRADAAGPDAAALDEARRTWRRARAREFQHPHALAQEHFARRARDVGCPAERIVAESPRVVQLTQAAHDGKARVTLSYAFAPQELVSVTIRSTSSRQGELTVAAGRTVVTQGAVVAAGFGMVTYDLPWAMMGGETALDIGGERGERVEIWAHRCQRDAAS